MSAFSSTEHEWMAHALRLARRGLYTTQPNPRVGCVLVNSGEIVGEGWHRSSGEDHAEIIALQAAGKQAHGSSAYITLEPCSHQGKTPPCVDALVRSGVAEVIIASGDPNPRVAGGGIDSLEQAGIVVRSGLLKDAAIELNEGFMSRFERGRPFVRLKIAASLDGKIAMASGESQWITGEAARRDVQRLRASSGAVMTGVATVIADNPRLTVREASIDNDQLQPLRVVLDSQLRMPASARMLAETGDTLVFCIDDQNKRPLEEAGAKVLMVPEINGRTDSASVLQQLAIQEINDVLVEAGPALAGSLLASGLVDELVIYQAPHIMGSETRGMLVTPEWQALDQRLQLDIIDVRMLGRDMRITARTAS